MIPAAPGSGARFLALASALLCAQLALSCASADSRSKDSGPLSKSLVEPPFPTCSVMVVSDLHLFSRELWTEGPALDSLASSSNKLLRESEEICDAALARVLEAKPDLLLISGDLTKDGEESGHALLARKLAVLRAAGIKVFVVPGNHDILNPSSFAYDGAKRSRVPCVSAARFAEIYAEEGYTDAISRDPASLSYVAEPLPGLRVIGIDSCDYDRNPRLSHSETGGRLSEARLRWIEEALVDARGAGKAVVAIAHHGFVEHFPGEAKYYGAYLVDDHERIGSRLASLGLKLVFTGHFHANDAATALFGSTSSEPSWLCDIETGSLASYPCPIRTISLGGGRVEVKTERLASAEGYPDLQAYAEDRNRRGIEKAASKTLREFGVSRTDADSIAPRVAEAFLAHYAGDEARPAGDVFPSEGLGLMGGIAALNRRPLIEGLWTDATPSDNDFAIDEGSGIQIR